MKIAALIEAMLGAALGAALAVTALGAPVTKVNARDGLVYAWIAPGSFTMGCSADDKDCFDWEEMPHQVTIAKGFWIGQTEVTQEAYERVTGANPSMYRGGRLPVEQIDWDDARRYCEAVGMRLPTEAEWEYAARGGSGAARYGELGAIGWFDGNGGDRTHEVGLKQANGFGLFDMIGNVWEWVDAVHSDASGESKKILRGGSFFNLARDVRVSNRLWATRHTRHRNMGARCVGD